MRQCELERREALNASPKTIYGCSNFILATASLPGNGQGTTHCHWDCTGVAIEVKHFDQYVIRVDILGRVTFRNQQFLKKPEKIQAFQLSSPSNDGPTDENEL